MAVAGEHPSIRLCKHRGASPLCICLQWDYWPEGISDARGAQREVPNVHTGAIFTASHPVPRPPEKGRTWETQVVLPSFLIKEGDM